MNCMKCGRELKDSRVFCSRCLTEMERYPVKPNTVVQLPQRTQKPAAKKAPRKKERKPEEQVLRLRSAVRWLSLLLAAALLAFAFTAVMLLRLLDQQEQSTPIGKNYTTQEPAPEI